MITPQRLIAIDPLIKLSAAQLTKLGEKFVTEVGWPSPGDKVEGILIHSRVTAEFLRSLPDLKWIAVRANNTDYAPTLADIEKFGIPPLSAAGVAELTFAFMLNMRRDLFFSNQNVKEGRWQEGVLHGELRRSTIGIIGGGMSGTRVANIARAFEMNVLIAASASKPHETPLEQLLRESDVVTLHIPSKGNDNFMGIEKFSLMKRSAIFINTSRGSVVDEGALRVALDTGLIQGAGLDVFKDEPPQPDSLAFHSKVLASPHMGFQTETTLDDMNEALVKAVLDRKGNLS